MTIANLNKDSSSSSSSSGGSAPSTPVPSTSGEGEKKFTCEYCDYTSSWPSHLRLHRMRHTGEKPYSCNECSFQTAWVGDLKRHQRVHTGERPYACQFCDFATAQKGNLNTHMRRYHVKSSGSIAPVNPALTTGLLSSLTAPAVESSVELFHQMAFPSFAALAQSSPSLNTRSPPGCGKQSPR